MARARSRTEAAGRLATLLSAGDHGAARAEAARLMADPAAPEGERERAVRVLAGLAPDRAAVAAGLLGLAVAVALLVLILVR